MRCAPRRSTATLALSCLLALASPRSAPAEMHVGAGAGGSVPWDSGASGGPAFAGQILASGLGDRLRLGGELEFRSYEVEMLGLDGIGVRSYDLRAIAQIVPFPRHFSPYAGLGVGVDLLELDDQRLEAALAAAGLHSDAYGLAAGGIAFLGLGLPLGEHFSLFAEGRAGLSFDLVGDQDADLEPGDLGAVTGMAGMRLRF
jgi:hypothetical protein